jgi:hypothetical protein
LALRLLGQVQVEERAGNSFFDIKVVGMVPNSHKHKNSRMKTQPLITTPEHRLTRQARALITPLRVSGERVARHQLVRLLAHPGDTLDRPLSVDWGRVVGIEVDVGRKVFCDLMGDKGASGGAVLDACGELVGVYKGGGDGCAFFESTLDVVARLQPILFPSEG